MNPRLLLLVVLTASGLASCHTTAGRSRSISSELNTGLDGLVNDDVAPRAGAVVELDIEELRDQDPTAMMALLAEAQRNSELSLEGGAAGDEMAIGNSVAAPLRALETSVREAEANRGPSLSLNDLVVEADGPPELIAASPAIEIVSVPGPAERYAQAMGELTAQLEDRARMSSAPARELVRLAALGLIDNEGAAPEPNVDDLLPTREASQLEAWRTFVRETDDGLSSAEGIESLGEAARRLADALEIWNPLSMPRMAFCSRVDGFGIYDEIARFGEVHKFLAGRPIKFLVYVELEHMAHTGVLREGVWGHEVSLEQDLRLYHMARGGDTLVWRLPDQHVNDFSRNKRRDFFIVQLIELPSTLSVGGYQFKLAITDRASGEVVEQIIPIEIVAHARALQDE